MNTRVAISALMAVLSGAAAALTLSGLDVFWLAWVAWVPFFASIWRATPRLALLSGFLAGVVLALGVWYWLPPTIRIMTRGKSGGWDALAIVALFWGINLTCLAWLSCVARDALRRLAPAAGSRLILLFAVPCLWVAMDYLAFGLLTAVSLWFSPLLAYSQWNHPVTLQIVSVTGIHGLTFLLVLVNVAIVLALTERDFRPLAAAAALLAVCLAGGGFRLRTADPDSTGKPVRVAILQGHIEAFSKFDKTKSAQIAHRYLALGKEISVQKPELVIWTETAIPWVLEEGDDLTEAMLKITSSSESCHVVGTFSRVPGATTNLLHNTAFMVLPDGRVVDEYHKIRMIPFVEMPMPLPWVPKHTRLSPAPAEYQLLPGKEISVLSCPVGVMGVTICNENFYPDMPRRQVLRGADFLVNMGNDIWCWNDLPRAEHFGVNIFRSIETGRDSVVANNAGVSGVVDAYGRVRWRTRTLADLCAVGEVRKRSLSTVYVRHGYLFPDVCAIASLLVLVGIALARIRRPE